MVSAEVIESNSEEMGPVATCATVWQFLQKISMSSSEILSGLSPIF